MKKIQKTKQNIKNRFTILGLVIMALAPIIYLLSIKFVIATCPLSEYNQCEFDYGFRGEIISMFGSCAIAAIGIGIFIYGIVKFVQSKK